MILDYEQFLNSNETGVEGQLFNAANGQSEYGGRPYDLKAGNDAAIGEPLDVLMRVVGDDSDVGTSLTVAVVESTTGAAGGTETVVATKTVLAANLTQDSLHYIDRIRPGLIAKRYLAAKVTTTGDAATAGRLKIWIQKAGDALPRGAKYFTE